RSETKGKQIRRLHNQPRQHRRPHHHRRPHQHRLPHYNRQLPKFRMERPSYTFTVVCILLSGVLASSNAMAAEPSGEPRWIEIGSAKAVILRDSKSADGRNALAWTIDSTEPVDWSLLEKDADHFY